MKIGAEAGAAAMKDLGIEKGIKMINIDIQGWMFLLRKNPRTEMKNHPNS